jgi:threonine 3-dehydrogenase
MIARFRCARFGSWVDTFKTNGKIKRILMTGAQGQVGCTLLPIFNRLYGRDNIFCTDISDARKLDTPNFVVANILEKDKIEKMIQDFKPDTIYHLSSILSAGGEKNPDLAIQVNVNGFQTMLDFARKYKTRLFSASTIATFGPSTPKQNVPNVTIQRPETIYGTTKVYMELLGSYYNKKYGVDFRSLRYPIVNSAALPGPATARCTVEIYYEALKHKKYASYLRGNRKLPLIYIDDVMEGTLQFMEADDKRFTSRVYNISGFSSSMNDLAESIKKSIPDFKMTEEIDPLRQGIADTWPESVDSSQATKDWGYKPKFDIPRMSAEMLKLIGENVKKGVTQ